MGEADESLLATSTAETSNTTVISWATAVDSRMISAVVAGTIRLTVAGACIVFRCDSHSSLCKGSSSRAPLGYFR
jgi:hypothetical protein